MTLTFGSFAAAARRGVQGIAALLFLAIACVATAQDSVTHEVVVDAPVAAVWRAWTTDQGLAAWLAPQASFDLRLGGLMRTRQDTAGRLGDAGTIENRVLAYEPERMLAIQVASAPADFPFRDRVGETWTVLTFVPTPGGGTRVRVVQLGFAADETAQSMRAFFERGNDYTLKLLQAHFAGRSGR